MANWNDDYDRMAALCEATDVESLSTTFDSLVGELGATGYAIACYLDSGHKFQRGIDSRLNGWVEHYDSHNYAEHCAIARRVVSSPAPFSWDDVRRNNKHDAFARKMFCEAESFDLKHGRYVPMMTRRGNYGLVFIKTAEEEVSSQNLSSLSTLAVTAHGVLQRLHVEQPANDLLPRAKLSAREHEILSWLANGKSAEDVADILGISAATVMFHYRSVSSRYGTLNRTHTVVEAIRRGDLKIDRA